MFVPCPKAYDGGTWDSIKAGGTAKKNAQGAFPGAWEAFYGAGSGSVEAPPWPLGRRAGSPLLVLHYDIETGSLRKIDPEVAELAEARSQHFVSRR